MPELQEYKYHLINDFPNSLVNTSELYKEIINSSISIALDRADSSDGYVSLWFKDILSGDDNSTLNSIINTHAGQTTIAVMQVDITSKDSHGVPIFSNQPRVGSETIHASVNFCDKASWFSDSGRVTDEVLVDDGTGLIFNGAHDAWIDMTSGRVLSEEIRIAEQKVANPGDPHGYDVVVKVDGYLMTERASFSAIGGDYRVFYEDGYIEFFSSKTGQIVTIDHSYATSSVYILKPLPGKILNIEGSEVDFSLDVEMNDAIFYTVYGFVEDFAPQYLDTQGGPYPAGTKIPLKTKKYKRMSQILKEATGSYPVLPKNCASESQYDLNVKDFRRESRGIKSGWIALPFRYGTISQLISSKGMEIHLGLENDLLFAGENATITFYCTSDLE